MRKLTGEGYIMTLVWIMIVSITITVATNDIKGSDLDGVNNKHNDVYYDGTGWYGLGVTFGSEIQAVGKWHIYDRTTQKEISLIVFPSGLAKLNQGQKIIHKNQESVMWSINTRADTWTISAQKNVMTINITGPQTGPCHDIEILMPEITHEGYMCKLDNQNA